jgi:MoaA/NifB/PqqE/SkfB family radical SAM enzyme
MNAAPTTESAGSGTLMLHLLGKCNLTCAHCYMEGAPQRRERLPLTNVLRAVEDCAELGVGQLYLTGGEPLMYPGLPGVLEAAASVPGLKTTLSTNATLLTARHVDKIAALGIALNVSIDGLPEYHDAFRRHGGAFLKSERGIELGLEAGVDVTVVMTVCRDNLASIAAVADWAVDKGVGTLRFQPLLKLGRGAAMADQRLERAEVDELVLKASDLANRYRGRLHCAIVGQSRRFMLAHPCSAYVCNGQGCHRRIAREIKKIVVREDGTVLPEATNLDPRFKIGRLGEGRLVDLVTRFLDEDYGRFDALCRRTYADVLPTWEAPVVPWDQILAEASCDWDEAALPLEAAEGGCGTCRAPAQAAMQ